MGRHFSDCPALDHDIEAFSIGGGLSTPYRDGDTPVDVQRYANAWKVARQQIEAYLGHGVRMEIEPGRFLVAEAGCLVSEVRVVKTAGQHLCVLVDTGGLVGGSASQVTGRVYRAYAAGLVYHEALGELAYILKMRITLLRDMNVDGLLDVIALGGGSVIDCAKAVAAVALGLFGGFIIKLAITSGAFASPLREYKRSGCGCGRWARSRPRASPQPSPAGGRRRAASPRTSSARS